MPIIEWWKRRWGSSWAKQSIDNFGPLLTTWGLVRLLIELRWQAYVTSFDAQRSVKLTLRTVPRLKAWVRPLSDDMSTLTEIFGTRVYADIVSHIPDCRNIVDLGGNIGLSAKYFNSAYPGCRIFSVEPLAENIEVLKQNLRKEIASGRCKVLQAAFSAENRESIDLYVNPGYWACSTIQGDSGKRIAVRGVSMDSILAAADFEHVDLVKVDIEGAEVELFRRTEWLTRTRAVAVEFHGNSRSEGGFDAALTEKGFRIVSEGKHTVLAVRT